MGFVNGALVQALSEPDGIVFNLCNENITYSDVLRSTKEKGGTLISVYASRDWKHTKPTFVTTGMHLLKGGLEYGDPLIAKCDYGCIRVRKVIGDVRLAHIAREKGTRTGSLAPKVWLWGGWLDSIGFTPDTLVAVASGPGCITLSAQGSAIVYSDVVRYARQNKMRLIKVTAMDGATNINFSGSSVARAGFAIGEMVAVKYGYGEIKLQKFEPGGFGF
jgi:hypothetical protein